MNNQGAATLGLRLELVDIYVPSLLQLGRRVSVHLCLQRPVAQQVGAALIVCTGVDKQTGTPCFLLERAAVRQLMKKLEQQLECDLSGALALIEAGLSNAPHKYDMVQQVHLAHESQYRGVINSFPNMARQSKSQVRAELWLQRAAVM